MASGVLALVVMEENMEKSEPDAKLKGLHFIDLKVRENLTILSRFGRKGSCFRVCGYLMLPELAFPVLEVIFFDCASWDVPWLTRQGR